MTENQKKVLEMLAQSKISVDDAYRLLNAIDSGEEGQGKKAKTEPENKTKPKYLRVTVTPGIEGASNPDGKSLTDGMVERVNVRIPMSLIRAGIKVKSLVPPEAMDKVNRALRDKGIDFDMRSVRPEDIEELVEALGDMQIDVEGGKGEKVKVFVE
jgi:hypothetical protein